MKQFAFPLSVKCANVNERDKCIDILKSLGYVELDRNLHDLETLVVTNYSGYNNLTTAWVFKSDYDDGRHHIDHFNPDLIRDIAAACMNNEWHEMEPVIRRDGSYGYTNDLHKLVSVKHSSHRRPTLAEICEHHGYEIKGRDIVKKVETVSNCDKSYCETALQLDEAKAEIKRLKSENADLKEKLEAITDVGNQELARLQRKVDELANRLQHNDKLHAKELEMLTDMITELSRDKAKLITKLNSLSAPTGIFHTSRPLEFHSINLPNMFHTKPAEFSEREKKRLLRLAERIERLIK